MTVLPACPPWCSEQPGHPYEGKGYHGTLFRYHVDAERMGDARSRISASISCEEQAVGGGGPAVQMPALIHLSTTDPALTAEEARSVAALLCRAADRLDALTGSQDGSPPEPESRV